MGKLNKEQRQRVGELCISAAVQNGNRKNVTVYTSSNEAGLAVVGVLSAAYPSFKFYKAENRTANTFGHIIGAVVTLGASNLVQAGMQTWKNFTVKTASNAEAQNLVKEINECIQEQQGYYPYTGGGNDDPYYPPSNGVDDNGVEKTVDWLTYIVIGVAVVIIALLIWNGRKKK